MKTWQAVARAALPTTQILPSAGHISGALESRPEGGQSSRTIFVPRLQQISAKGVALYKWLQQRRTQQLSQRRLRITETVSLGEKRFVSIIQVDGAQFLIGSAAGNVSLLTRLGDSLADAPGSSACDHPGSGRSS